jgi:acetyl esterase/lipase
MLTRRRFGRLAAMSMLGGAAAACTPLTAFDDLTPKDTGSTRIAHDLPFGPGPRGTLDIYAPSGRAAAPRPVLVFFYGGSWADGRKEDYAFAGRAFAARGFVTVIADYRLVPEVRFPGFVQDGAAAVRWTRDHIGSYGGDPDRIALAGHSAGAYNAMMLALDPRWLTEAGVDPKLVRAVAGLSGPYDFYPFDVKASIDAFGQAPDPAATQPINFARPGAPPAFLGTGDKDTTVRPRNSLRLAEALRGKRDEVELKVYPGLDHAAMVLALSVPFRGRAPVLNDVTDFLARHTAS